MKTSDYRYRPRKDLRFKIKIIKEMIPEKAEILGYLCGDGSVRSWYCESPCRRKDRGNKVYFKRRTNFDMSFDNTNKQVLLRFLKCFKKVYGFNPSIFKKGKCISTGRRDVIEDLLRYTKYNSYNWKVPEQIMKGNLKIRKGWLRSFFDSEAHVKDSGAITINSVNKKGLLSVQKLLNSLYIPSKIRTYTWKKYIFYRLYIKKDMAKIFLDKIGFCHSERKDRLLTHLGGDSKPF